MLFELLELNKLSILICFLLFFLQSVKAGELGSSWKGLVLSMVALGLGWEWPLNWGQLEYCRPSGPWNMYKEWLPIMLDLACIFFLFLVSQ